MCFTWLTWIQTGIREPVVAARGTGFDLRREDLPALFAEYEKPRGVCKEIPESRGFNFFHFMIDLEQGPCLEKNKRSVRT